VDECKPLILAEGSGEEEAVAPLPNGVAPEAGTYTRPLLNST